jgi:hypothetical protein
MKEFSPKNLNYFSSTTICMVFSVNNFTNEEYENEKDFAFSSFVLLCNYGICSEKRVLNRIKHPLLQ